MQNLNLKPTNYHQEKHQGFEQIVPKIEGASHKLKTYLTLKKDDNEIISISTKILKGPSLWEKFKNLFTRKYIKQDLIDCDGNRISLFVKIGDITNRLNLSHHGKSLLEERIRKKPQELEKILVEIDEVTSVATNIKNKYERNHIIEKIPNFSSFALSDSTAFTTVFAKEIQQLQKKKSFKNLDLEPPMIKVAYGSLMNSSKKEFFLNNDINLNEAEYFDVNVWYDDREDVCFILVRKIGDYDPRDLYSAEKIAKLVGKEFKK